MIIEKIKEEVKIIFQNDASGHDYWHSIRVYNNAMRIAEHENCNKEIVELAALLHDVDDKKLFVTMDYANARTIMKKNRIDDKTISQVVAIIQDVSFQKTGGRPSNTIEGRIVQDADRLDAMGAIGIARTFAYGGSRGQCMFDPTVKSQLQADNVSNKESVGSSVNHFYEKLFSLKKLMNTETAKKVAEQRDSFMHFYMEEFYQECEGI